MKNQKLFTLLITILLTCTSCAPLMMNRSFVDEMDRESEGFFAAGRDFETVPGDKGSAYRSREDIQRRTPASRMQREMREEGSSIQKELARKLNALSPQDYEQYRQREPYLQSASQKIYYLDLPPRDRLDYLASLTKEENTMSERRNGRRPLTFLEASSIRQNNLYLGMRKDKVVSSWGRPAKIEIAGDPRNQNEKWSFYENGKLRHVYFESGSVQGWSVDNYSQSRYPAGR